MTIPNGVKTIGKEAFARCSSLHTVDIPESVDLIEEGAFRKSGLFAITIPGSVGKFAFSECQFLSEVIISEGAEIIGETAFRSCSSLISVKLPSTLKEISAYAFGGIPITEIDIPSGVTTIGDHAFANTRVKKIKIPESVSSIGEGAFRGCIYLEEVILPQNIKTIPCSIFHGCWELKNIALPYGLEKIESEAFSESGLEKLVLPDSVTSIGSEAFANTKLTEVKSLGRITEIESGLFSGCEELQYVIIPNGVQIIGYEAFRNCYKLNDIIIPESVKGIYPNSIGYRINIYETEKSNPDLRIHGKAGTAAQRYADINGFRFIIDAESISFVPGEKQTLKQGDQLKLEVQLTPSDSNADLAWSSSNPSVAMVKEDGTVTAQGTGNATITASTWNGVSASIEIEVVLPEPDEITITQGSRATLYMGNKLTLKAKVKPSNAQTKLTWKSSKPKIATVSSKGVVTPKAAGNAAITVKTSNGKSAKITVKVIDAKSVKLKEGANKTLKVGKKLTLHAVVSPSKVKTKLTWSSSNKKVATVSSKGVVKAIEAGTAKITVKTANGKKATITITVN